MVSAMKVMAPVAEGPPMELVGVAIQKSPDDAPGPRGAEDAIQRYILRAERTRNARERGRL